jgi:hypothetical protein
MSKPWLKQPKSTAYTTKGVGGFILSTGAVLDDAQPANLHAMIDAGKKYGGYK